MDFNTFLKMYKEWQNKPHMYIVNQIQMKHFEAAYKNLEELIYEYSPDAKVSVVVNEFNDGSAYMSVVTDDVVVKDINKFISIIEHASNFEIYPLVDGNITINITFNDFMELIK